MNKWELAYYLIDAKKCVDSMMFISRNVRALRNIDLLERGNELRRKFYINCCVVLDKSFVSQKKRLCAEDEIVKRLYYERDKTSAHKDENYEPRKYSTWGAEIAEKKKELSHIRDICKDHLPQVLSLNYVPHDRIYFRLVNGVTEEKEEQIKHKKHPQYGEKPPEGSQMETRKPFYNIDQLKQVRKEGTDNYCVLFEAGLNTDEMTQNAQHFCILMNLLFDQDCWMKPQMVFHSFFGDLKRIGLIDTFETPNPSFELTTENLQKVADVFERYRNEQT